MQILVRKMQKFGLLKLEFISGAIIMALAAVVMPVGILIHDASLLANPYLLGTVAVAMAMFLLVGYFCFMRPYLLYRKTPDVLAETDGEFLYLHTRKEAKIPLSDLTWVNARPELPFLFEKEFLREILLYFFSEEYGNVVLEIEGYGSYRMRFVPRAYDLARELADYFDKVMNNA